MSAIKFLGSGFFDMANRGRSDNEIEAIRGATQTRRGIARIHVDSPKNMTREIPPGEAKRYFDHDVGKLIKRDVRCSKR